MVLFPKKPRKKPQQRPDRFSYSAPPLASWLVPLPDFLLRGGVRERSTVVEVKTSSGREIKANVVKWREASLALGESGQVWFEAFSRTQNKEQTGTCFVRSFAKSSPSLLRRFWTSGLAVTLNLKDGCRREEADHEARAEAQASIVGGLRSSCNKRSEPPDNQCTAAGAHQLPAGKSPYYSRHIWEQGRWLAAAARRRLLQLQQECSSQREKQGR